MSFFVKKKTKIRREAAGEKIKKGKELKVPFLLCLLNVIIGLGNFNAIEQKV